MDSHTLPASLQDALIASLPATGYYLPNFITETEEADLLRKVKSPGFISILSHRSH